MVTFLHLPLPPRVVERTREHHEQLVLARKALEPLLQRKKACDRLAERRAGGLMVSLGPGSY